jgi:threonine dehydratase
VHAPAFRSSPSFLHEPLASAGNFGQALAYVCRGRGVSLTVSPRRNGALASGVGRWIKATSPATRVIAVANRGAPAMAEAWMTGESQTARIEKEVRTIADGIAVRVPIPAAVADTRRVVDEVRLVDDETLIAAMRLLYEQAGLVSEPAGAAGIAAVMAAPGCFEGLRVATILTGSNAAPDRFRSWINL